jgi:VIT1/CCC1 family predicted Fe2+/Mn2+ transporter
MDIGASWQRLRSSFNNSTGTIVFGMEDGTVSIFGLIFGVAATTTDTKTVLIAGACGAAAAAVSMMAGAYLDAETTRDEADVTRSALFASGHSGMSLSNHLMRMGLTAVQSDALATAVQNDRNARDALLLAIKAAPKTPLDPLEQALCWRTFSRRRSRSCHSYFFQSSRHGSSPGQSRSPCSSCSALGVPESQSATRSARYLKPSRSALPLPLLASQSACLSIACSPRPG